MFIKRLEIENLRSIQATNLEFNAAGEGSTLEYPNVNVLLGGNGLGKTSVLRAAALSILGPLLSSSSGFVSEGMVRRPSRLRNFFSASSSRLKPALVRAHVDTRDSALLKQARLRTPNELILQTEIRSLGSAERLSWQVDPPKFAKMLESIQFRDDDPSFFIVGYGATRRVESSSRVDESARIKSRLRRYERVAGLFEDHLALIPLSYWLPDFMKENKGRYIQIISLINELLPESCRILGSPVLTPHGREHMFEMHGVALPFRLLSDGYKAYIGWIGDMLFHICMSIGSGKKIREISGIVLVDEIDLHLHPEWQRVVVPTLAKALPCVQFVVTTHSPLVVGSLEAANLYVLVEENHSTVVKRLPEGVRGRSAEQILLSPYFGLESTRATGTAEQLSNLAKQAVSGNKKASIQYLELLANQQTGRDTDPENLPPKEDAPRKEGQATPRKKAARK